MKRVILLLATIALSVGIAYAGGVVVRHNFDDMYNAGTLAVTNSNKTGTIVGTTMTYTCAASGSSTARFFSDLTETLGKKCIQLSGSGAKVTTTTIEALDSLVVHYCHNNVKKEMRVYISSDNGSNWSQKTVVQEMNGISTVKMPSVGDYMVRIQQLNDDIWIDQIDYHTTPPCNCLRVQIE